MRCTADSFLGACKRLVEAAALQRQPGATSSSANGQRRKPAKAGARLAVRSDDRRVRSNKATARSTTAGDTRAEDEVHQWAKKRARKAKQRVYAIKARDVEEYASDEEYADSELVCEDEGINLVAAFVIA